MSNTKELFSGRRVPVPGFIIDLFLNDECTIDDELKFFENVQKKLAEITIMERAAGEYDSWKYLIFRIFEIIEKRIQALASLKANNYADREALIFNEKSIEVLIYYLDEFLRKVDDLENFIFPYFDQLLELTSNPQIITKLTILGLTILFHENYDQKNLSHVANLFIYLDPYIKLLQHYQWDFGVMIKELSEIFKEKKSSDKLPNSLKELLGAVLDNGKLVVKILEENSNLEKKNPTDFVFSLYSKILEECRIAKAENEQKYFQAIGEAALVSFLLEPELDGKILSSILTMHCFKGTFLEAIRRDNEASARVMNLTFEPYHFQFKFVLKPSVIDVALEKCKEIGSFEDLNVETHGEKLDILISYLVGIKRNIELFKGSTIMQDPGDDIAMFLHRLFCVDHQKDNITTNPPIFVIWKIAMSLYARWYSKVEDETFNTFGKLGESIKDKVNILAYHVVSLIGSSLSEMTEGTEEENGESKDVFREEYSLTANDIVEEMIKKFEEFALDKNYVSIMMMFAMCSTFKEIGYIHISSSPQMPVRLIKKIESLLTWCYTQEFADYFATTPNPELSFKVVLYLLEMVGTIFNSYDGAGLAGVSRKDYVTYMSTSGFLDLISTNSNKDNLLTNEYAIRLQEEIIRYYIALHMGSQLLCFGSSETEQLFFYDFGRLKQVWSLILQYSRYENYIQDEFGMTIEIIENIESEDFLDKQVQILDIEVMNALFSKCLLNIDINADVKEFEPIKEILITLSQREGWEIFTTQLSIVLQEKFEALLDAAEALESLYIQGEPSFTRSFFVNEYRICELFKRIYPLIKLMRTYEFGSFSNDSNIQSVMSGYLPKLMISPVFYLVGFVNIPDFIIILPKLSISASILESVLPNYAARAFETIVTVNQGLQEPDSQSLIRRILDSEKTRHYSMDKFFVASYLDEPKDIHDICSRLFYSIFLNTLGLKNFSDSILIQPAIKEFMINLQGILPEIMRSLIKTRQSTLKAVMTQGRKVNVSNFIIPNDDDLNSWTSLPQVKEYFKSKANLLLDLLAKAESAEDSKDDFLYKISIVMNIQEMMVSITPEDSLTLYRAEGSVENILDFCFDTLSTFIKVISTNFQQSRDSNIPITEYRMKIEGKEESVMTEGNFKTFFGVVLKAVMDQFDSLLRLANISINHYVKNDRQKEIKDLCFKLTKRVWDKLPLFLSLIDPNLLSLYITESSESLTLSPSSIVLAVIFTFHMNVNILHKITEIYIVDEQTEQTNKPHKVFKARNVEKKHKKGRKPYKGAKGKHRPSKHEEEEEEEEEEFFDEDQEVNKNKEDEVHDGENEQEKAKRILQRSRELYKEMLGRFLLFYYYEFPPVVILQPYREILKDFVQSCEYLVTIPTHDFETHQRDFSQLKEARYLDVKIYKNPSINKLRIICPLLLFLTRFMNDCQFTQESEHGFYQAILTKLINELVSLFNDLNMEDLLKEDQRLVENDFIRILKGAIHALIGISEQLLVYYFDFDAMLPKFIESYELLYLALGKWGDIYNTYKAARVHSTNLLAHKNLLMILYYGAHVTNNLSKFASDTKIIDLLIKSCDKYFYVIAELFVLQAYEPEKILGLKIKSMVHIDKSASRVFQNFCLKTIERFWHQTMKKVWDESIEVQSALDKNNKHTSKIAVVKENPDMKGRIDVSIGEKMVNVSAYTFLKQGISNEARLILNAIINNIVQNVHYQVLDILKDPKAQQNPHDFKGTLYSVIGCLSVLVRNYPELSAPLASHTLINIGFPEGQNADFLPQWSGTETFLSFFVKYACYFYHFLVSYFLECLIEPSETPVFIHYEGKPLLLSSYNELIIFREIIKVLEGTLKVPEKFLKTMYTAATWTILSQISINLLKVYNEPRQRNFRLGIIQRLYSLCLEALKVHSSCVKKQEIHLVEETKVIYVFMAELANIEVSIRTKEQLLQHPKKLEESLLAKKKLNWISCLFKEQSYVDPSLLASFDIAEPVPLEEKSNLSEEEGLLEGFKPKSEGIRTETITEIFDEVRMIYFKPQSNLSQDNLFVFSKDQTKELEAALKRFGSQSKYWQQLKDNQQKQMANDLCACLTDLNENISGTTLTRFGLEHENLTSKPKLFLVDLLKSRAVQRTQPPPRFRVFVKKTMKWHLEKATENKATSVQELLDENKEENFGMLIRKMGVENLNKLIKKNQRRVKLIIRQQHEKFLMTKLEALLKQEVNITQMMSLQVDVNNLSFFNEQTDLDKKLILLLANKDFIKTLGEEFEHQSKSLRKAFFEEEKKEKEEDDDEEGNSDEDMESEEDRRARNLRHNRRRREEMKQESDYEEEEDFEDGSDNDDGEDEYDEEDDGDEEEDEEDEDNLKPEKVVNNIEKVQKKKDENKEIGLESDEEAKEKEEEEKARKQALEKQNLEEEKVEKEKEKDDEKKLDEMKFETVAAEPNKELEIQVGKEEEIKDNEEEIESVSSDCHTSNLSEEYYDQGQEENDFEEPYSDEEGGEEDGDDSVNYDYLYEISDDTEENSELTDFKGFMAQAKRIEKTLQEAKFVLRPKESHVPNPQTQRLLGELPDYIFFLFANNQKIDALDSASNSFEMDTYSLFYKFLILMSLDPNREETVLPLLALHLLGYNPKVYKTLQAKNLVKSKIVNFLHQYAIRSPSIFFKTFSIDNYEKYFAPDEPHDESLKSFTIIDILFRFYFLSSDDKDLDAGMCILLQRLLHLLLQVRFLCKNEELPNFIKELRKNSQAPLKQDIMEQVFKISEKLSKLPKSVDITHFCKWLEYLARLPQYRNGIILACDRMLLTQIPEEQGLLNHFIKEAKQTLGGLMEPTSTDRYYYNNFSSRLNPQIPIILNILSYILNEEEIDTETKSLIRETDTFKIGLKDISLYYMEALELISQLKDKNYIEYRTNLRVKLKKMVEVPAQYYLYLAKLKDTGAAKMMDTSGGISPELHKGFVDTENLAPLPLERSYSSIRKEGSNFPEILINWMKKHRNFINTTFKTSSVGEENLDLWIVKKFPWVLDFNVKKKILMDAFAERDREEEENNEDDEEITLFIRRKHILKDTLREFERNSKDDSDTLYRFRIEFVGEPGVDQGGLKKEWLNLLIKELFDPSTGLFKLSPNLRSIHPSPLSLIQPGTMNYFKFAGTLVGLAIKEKIPIDVNFSKSFLKLIMDIQPNLNDLEDLDPDFMQSLTWMLNNDVTGLEQPFIYELEILGIKTVQELKEGGINIMVDEQNKESFVSKVLMAKTLKEVEPQINNFKEGFFKIVPEDLVKLFSCGELEILISGESNINIKDLMEYTTYKELSKDSLLVKWFWEIVEIMDQNMLANLLFFITGSPKVPHGGFKDSPIVLMRGPSDTSSLPIAHTCFSELEIPLYESKEQFFEKLFLAISEGKEGFYIA